MLQQTVLSLICGAMITILRKDQTSERKVFSEKIRFSHAVFLFGTNVRLFLQGIDSSNQSKVNQFDLNAHAPPITQQLELLHFNVSCWSFLAFAECQIINVISWPVNKSCIWLWIWAMNPPVDATHPACWVWVSVMTWCPLLPLLFPPLPTWKIGTTVTNTEHGGLWRSLSRQHHGLSERTGGAFWAADPSPRGGASKRHPAARARQPASQRHRQPTAGMAAGGDAGKWRQHAGQPPLVFFNHQLDLPCVCLRAYLSEVAFASHAPSFHQQVHSIITSAHGHCF